MLKNSFFFWNSDSIPISINRAYFLLQVSKSNDYTNSLYLVKHIFMYLNIFMEMANFWKIYAQIEYTFKQNHKAVHVKEWDCIRSINPLFWEMRICEYWILVTEFSNKYNEWT